MTSLDQRHTAPYSADMRWRVVWKRFSKQQTFLEIAKSLEIAPSTAHRIFTEFIERGDVDPKGKRGPKPDFRHKMPLSNNLSVAEQPA